MNPNADVVKDAVVRVLVVAGIAIAFGYLVFGSAVFNVRMTWFEFVENGVTVGIAYMTFKSNRVRIGFLVLFFWYLFLIAFLFVPHNNWNPIMEASYVVGLTASVYVYFLLDRKHIIKGPIQRIICASLLIGFAHGVIVLFLQLITLRVFVHTLETLSWGFMNLKNGTVIGLLCGIGMELTEPIINSHLLHRDIIGAQFQCSNCGGDLQEGDTLCKSCGETIEWLAETGGDLEHE